MNKEGSGKIGILELDKKGRLTLPKEVRESLNIGKKVFNYKCRRSPQNNPSTF